MAHLTTKRVAAVRLVVHAVAFAAVVYGLRPAAVQPVAWGVLFLLGAGFLWLAPRPVRFPHRPGVWLMVLACTMALAALCFGVDTALNVLGNSVKRRAGLPAWLGGLELYWLLVPGCSSVALGGFAGAWVAAKVGQDRPR